MLQQLLLKLIKKNIHLFYSVYPDTIRIGPETIEAKIYGKIPVTLEKKFGGKAYFITYFSLAIFSLYILRSANINYTTIVAASVFIAFLINCAFIAMPSMYDGLDFSKINWTMMGVYTFTWLFIMFKSLQEIFNF